MSAESSPFDERFPVAVVTECRQVQGNRWLRERWRVVSVTVGAHLAAGSANPLPMADDGNSRLLLWTGLQVRLYPDEVESYYHNLMVEQPGCFVVTRAREDGVPEPVLVTVSFDEAQAYQEADGTVDRVPLPAELYRAAEAFVLEHYVPEPRKKRRLENWKEGTGGGH